MGRIQTDETRKKISMMYKQRISKGWISPLAGKPKSEEHKEKMRQNHADVSGLKNPMYGKKPGKNNQMGPNNPNWKSGIGIYRKKAFETLPKECKECKIKEINVLLVHHIDRNRKNNSIDNLEILCRNCHFLEHLKDYDFQRKVFHKEL